MQSFEKSIMSLVDKKIDCLLKERYSDKKQQVVFFKKCDSCSVYPISDVKYTCTICKSLNLCQKCEHMHNHPKLEFNTVDLSDNFEFSDSTKNLKNNIKHFCFSASC